MDFDFSKFVKDIEKRDDKRRETRHIHEEAIELDRQRRLRAERYHERWQNRIKWEENR